MHLLPLLHPRTGTEALSLPCGHVSSSAAAVTLSRIEQAWPRGPLNTATEETGMFAFLDWQFAGYPFFPPHRPSSVSGRAPLGHCNCEMSCFAVLFCFFHYNCRPPPPSLPFVMTLNPRRVTNEQGCSGATQRQSREQDDDIKRTNFLLCR